MVQTQIGDGDPELAPFDPGGRGAGGRLGSHSGYGILGDTLKIRILLLVVAVVLVSAPALAAPPPLNPQDETGELLVSPPEVRAGEAASVVGEGCAPGNQVQFDFYNPKLSSSAQASAKGDGTFVLAVGFPANSKIGRTWLRATCLTSASHQRVMQAVVLVSRPKFVITGVNLAFGAGTLLVVLGLGLLALRSPAKRRRRA
jgi:hypothetical protein